MLRGWLAEGLPASDVSVVDPFATAAPDGVRLLKSVPAGESPPETLLLAIKPQSLDSAAPALAPAVGERTLVISILAGVETGTLASRLGAPSNVSAMPHTAAPRGRSVPALFGKVRYAAPTAGAGPLRKHRTS